MDPNLSNVSFWRSNASCNSTHGRCEACSSPSPAVHLPGYSKAEAGGDPRNIASSLTSSEPRKRSLPPVPGFFGPSPPFFSPPSLFCLFCLQLGGLSSWPFQCWKGARAERRRPASCLSFALASLQQLATATTCSVQASLGNFSWKTENSNKRMQPGFSSVCNMAKFEHSFRELVQCVFLTERSLLPNFACNASKH